MWEAPIRTEPAKELGYYDYDDDTIFYEYDPYSNDFDGASLKGEGYGDMIQPSEGDIISMREEEEEKAEENVPNALSRIIVIQGSITAIKMHDRSVEEQMYTSIHNKDDENIALKWSEINLRRYMSGIAMGDQGDSASIDAKVYQEIEDEIKQNQMNMMMKKNKNTKDHHSSASKTQFWSEGY